MTSRLFRAPGRVNLIGEHTDYNDGFVLPAAIEFSTLVRATPGAEGRLRAESAAFPERLDLAVASPFIRQNNWSDYVLGVAAQLRLRGISVPAVDLAVTSDVPAGAGLSSSAALLVSTALALLAQAGVTLPGIEIARLCQEAEIDFTGTRCGIMDQFVAVHAQRHHALLLDCRSLNYELVPLPQSVALVVANTMIKHELSGSEYNVRRGECELAAARAGLASLRDLTSPQPDHDTPGRRARHVWSENARVHDFVEALRSADLPRVGRLMEESHWSLRDDYEVSCPELDLMVSLAQRLPGYLGGRMTGGGFGGSTVNLVEAGEAMAFVRALREAYASATGLRPGVYITQAGAGAGEVL